MKLQTFNYLHNSIYKKEVFSKRLNIRYVKFYKWIDKKNWGFADMDLNDPTNSDTVNSISKESHLIYQPSLSFANLFSNDNYQKDYLNSKTSLVIVTKQMDTISKRNAKQQTRWNRFFQQCNHNPVINTAQKNKKKL
jgi:hypothetical protein